MGRLEVWTRLALVAWAMVITMARAVRFPNDFAEAHWLLDYRFGFIKRGFAGSLLSLASNTGLVPQSETGVAVVAFTAWAAFALLLLWASARLVSRGGDPGVTFAAAAVFATSPFLVMTAHFMGYMDHLFLAAAFAAAWLARRGRVWAAAGVAGVAVLIHESFVLAGLPLVLVGASLRPRAPGGARLLPLALPVLAALALWVSDAFLLDAALLRGQMTARLSAFPFVGGDMHLFVPEWLTAGTMSTWHNQRHAAWRFLSDPNLLKLMVPSAAFLTLAAAALSPPGTRTRRAVTAALAVCAPLLLHAVAWDTARIWTYTIVAGFGCVWLCGGDDRRATAAGRRWLLASAMPIVLANIFGTVPLMDGQADRFTASTRAVLYLPFLAGAVLAIADGWHRRT